MIRNLVERLRKADWRDADETSILDEAADTIERLQQRVVELESALAKEGNA